MVYCLGHSSSEKNCMEMARKHAWPKNGQSHLNFPKRAQGGGDLGVKP